MADRPPNAAPNGSAPSDSGPETAPEPEAGRAPATGTTDEKATHAQPVEEPNLSGTLFFTLFLLMIIFGFWVVMYLELLSR